MASSAAVPITSTPADKQLVEHAGKTYETIREGHAYILIPPGTQKHVDPNAKVKADDPSLKPQNVFYNPIQQFNRDLSVLSIKAFGQDFLERKKQRSEKTRARNNRKNTKKKQKQAATVADEVGEEDNSKKRKRDNEDVDESDQEEGGVKVPKLEEDQPAPAEKDDAVAPNGQPDAKTNGDTVPKRPQFRILDALSATGLRALRYAKEIPFVTSIVANDMNSNATKSMALNIQHNDLADYIKTNTGDAIGHMYGVAYPPTGSHGPHHISQKYDVIDLDPYGTAAPFIDSALQALNDGGLLCVTCTDSGVFASTGYCEKTYSLYGGMPVKGPYMHEGGLRLIISSIATAAAKYGIAIEPLLSLSIDFYVRVFIRVRKSAADVKFLAGKTMLVYCCDSGCGAWTTNMLGRNAKQAGKNDSIWFKHSIAQAPSADRLCEHCGSKTHVAGPMWAGPIHNGAFIEKVLQDLDSTDPTVYETIPRIEGMLTTALGELLVNEPATTEPVPPENTQQQTDLIPMIPPQTTDLHPFFFNPSATSKVIHCVAPSDAAIKGALRHAGFRTTRSHCQPGSIKTDAPWSAIWEIMREWVRQKQPIKEGALKETTAGYRIMQAARKPEDAEEASSKDGEETPEIITETRPASAGKGAERIKVVFDEVLGKEKPRKRLVRYQQNPRENWGPMTKAKGPT